MQLIRASEFARIANVSREAIRRASMSGALDTIKKGRAVYVDLEGPSAVLYLSKRQSVSGIMADNAPRRPAAESGSDGEVFISKAEADRLKAIAQAAKINAELSAYVGDLIEKSQVNRLFGRIHYVQSDLFIPIGDRLAPVLAAMCDRSDPETINAIKIKIDEEIFRGLAELKRVTSEDLA